MRMQPLRDGGLYAHCVVTKQLGVMRVLLGVMNESIKGIEMLKRVPLILRACSLGLLLGCSTLSPTPEPLLSFEQYLSIHQNQTYFLVTAPVPSDDNTALDELHNSYYFQNRAQPELAIRYAIQGLDYLFKNPDREAELQPLLRFMYTAAGIGLNNSDAFFAIHSEIQRSYPEQLLAELPPLGSCSNEQDIDKISSAAHATSHSLPSGIFRVSVIKKHAVTGEAKVFEHYIDRFDLSVNGAPLISIIDTGSTNSFFIVPVAAITDKVCRQPKNVSLLEGSATVDAYQANIRVGGYSLNHWRMLDLVEVFSSREFDDHRFALGLDFIRKIRRYALLFGERLQLGDIPQQFKNNSLTLPLTFSGVQLTLLLQDEYGSFPAVLDTGLPYEAHVVAHRFLNYRFTEDGRLQQIDYPVPPMPDLSPEQLANPPRHAPKLDFSIAGHSFHVDQTVLYNAKDDRVDFMYLGNGFLHQFDGYAIDLDEMQLYLYTEPEQTDDDANAVADSVAPDE